MSTNTYSHTDPWREEQQVFRVVAIVVLLVFGGFVLYDGRRVYQRHLDRCLTSPELPECRFLRIAKPKPRPELGIVLDHDSGKWAIQLEAMDQKTVNENSSRLTQAGANSRVIKSISRKKTTFYYLQLGRFKTQKEAVEAGNQLKARDFVKSFTVGPYRSASN